MPHFQLHHVQLAIPPGGEPDARACNSQDPALTEIEIAGPPASTRPSAGGSPHGVGMWRSPFAGMGRAGSNTGAHLDRISREEFGHISATPERLVAVAGTRAT